MGVVSSGMGLGYDRRQFTSGHGPPHGMLRQKSIGEAVCSFRLPLHVHLSVCPLDQWSSTLCCCLSVAKGNVHTLFCR